MYLIPRGALTKKGRLPKQIDFDYGSNASINVNDQWYPYLFRSLDELKNRYEALPLLVKVDDDFEFPEAA